jgi:hypothetical protein
MPVLRRTWFSLLTFCLVRVVLVALLFATVVVGGVWSFAGGQTSRPRPQNLRNEAAASDQVFSGVVTDSACGARHDKYSGKNSAECVHACIRNGAHYQLVNGDSAFFLEGRMAELNRFAGQRVRISGEREDDIIRVASISLQ